MSVRPQLRACSPCPRPRPRPRTRPPRRGARRCALAAAVLSLFGSGCGALATLSGPREATFAAQIDAGDRAYRHLIATHTLVDDPGGRGVVEEVGRRLADASGRNDLHWEFQLVADETPRVSAFPSGQVVVTDAMLASCPNEGMLAAVMANGMGHVLSGHWHSPVSSAADKNSDLKSQPGSPDSDNSALKQAETESIALSLLVRAGYDPDAMQTADSRRSSEFLQSLAQARLVYRSQSDKLGYGQEIAYRPASNLSISGTVGSASPRQPPKTRASSESSGVVWTKSIDHGSAKPPRWVADHSPASSAAVSGIVADDGGRFLPPTTGGVQQAGYQWSSTTSSDDVAAPTAAPARGSNKAASPGTWYSLDESPGPRPAGGPLLP